MTTWEERMAAKAEARAEVLAAERAAFLAAEEADRLGHEGPLVAGDEGSLIPDYFLRKFGIAICRYCYPDAPPTPERYVWNGANWEIPAYDVGWYNLPPFPCRFAPDYDGEPDWLPFVDRVGRRWHHVFGNPITCGCWCHYPEVMA